MTDIERMNTLQEQMDAPSVTLDQYREAVAFAPVADLQPLTTDQRIAYCKAAAKALLTLLKREAPAADDPRAFCLEMVGKQLQLHQTLYPDFVDPGFMTVCAELAEVYPLSAKAFAEPVLAMGQKARPFDLTHAGIGRRRQTCVLPQPLQDVCEILYSEVAAYWSLVVTTEAPARRRALAAQALKQVMPLAELPSHADTDLKILDLVHIAQASAPLAPCVYKSDFYGANCIVSAIAISSVAGEFLSFSPRNRFPDELFTPADES